MKPDLERIEALFQRAADLPPAERQAFLDAECAGEPELRERVQHLLLRWEQDESLEAPHFEPGASGDEDDKGEGPGTLIGRYKLLQHIGDGGFGSVWMAEQTEPLVRKVALKIIKLGMDTKQVIARFEAERQALAMMDHPNIARVFDAGATATGRPYFVMELVRGISITEYCDQNKLDTAGRLELFIDVCQAVQHAHQKGVIHRDLKPSNVMVTLHDGKPVPKVIDFGIAKAMHSRLTEKTLFTEYSQFIGTPVYMSPEQAEMSGLDVDTRADIYSLGVLLYELLTGTTPFDMQTLLQSGYAQIRKVIREQEPPKPSARVSTLGDTSTLIAEQRRIDASGLRRRLQGDLDWIVMCALEKERGRRYATAREFGEDIRRHLDHEPVEAGPPGTAYRVRKLLVKNRVFVAWAATITLLLLAGIAGTTWGMLEASRQRDEAVLARILAEDRGQEMAHAQELEHEQRLRAQEAARQATSITDYLAQTLALTNPEVTGSPDLPVRVLLDRASDNIAEAFDDQPLSEATVRSIIGRAYTQLAEFDLAEGHLRRAAELMDDLEEIDGLLHYQTLWALTDTAFTNGAEDAFACAYNARQVAHALIREQHPELADALTRCIAATDQGRVEQASGPFGTAKRLAAASLRVGDPLWLVVADGWLHAGYSLWHSPLEPQSEMFWRAALEIQRRELGEDNAKTAVTLTHLIGVLNRTGKAREAEAELRQAVATLERVLGEDNATAAFAASMLGENLTQQGRFEEAQPFVEASHAVLRKVQDKTGFFPIDSQSRLVKLYLDWGKPEAAEPHRRELAEMCAYAPFLAPFAITRSIFDAELVERLDRLDRISPLDRFYATGEVDLEKLRPSLDHALEASKPVLAPGDATSVVLARMLVHASAAMEPRAGAGPDRLRLLSMALPVLEEKGELVAMDLSDALAQRSVLALDEGRPGEAEEMARRSWFLMRDVFGTRSRFSAAAMMRIAQSLAEQELYEESESMYLEGYEIFLAQIGPSHFETTDARERLIALYERWGREDMAQKYRNARPETPRSSTTTGDREE